MFTSINKILRRWILPSTAETTVGLEHWRYEFFFMICRLLLVGNTLITLGGIYALFAWNDYNISIAILILNPIFFVLIVGRNIKQLFRQWGLIILFFSAGLFLLIIEGLLGSALIFLFVHPILSAIFFGQRKAQISLWVNGLILAGVNIVLFFRPEMHVSFARYDLVTWLFSSIAFVFINMVVTNAITRLVQGLHESLNAEINYRIEIETEIENRIELEEILRKERENLQVRVDERTSLLAKANEDLMKSMKFKDAFFDSIRHEFRTPIHAISGYTDLLSTKTENLTEKQESYLKRIRESADHLLGVVNNILDTTRIQAGMLDIHTSIISLSDVCTSAVAYIEGEAVRKGVSIQAIKCDEQVNIKADPQRFKQVLMNLLENSVKYTPKGGQVGLELNRTEQEFCLTVWDTGIGIPDADINHIFEPFYRSENRNVQDVEGTGLGLSLAKQLVEAHDWTITVESEVEKGTRFSIHIPGRDLVEHRTVLYY